MAENQQVVFLSDGGDSVRNLQEYIHPYSEQRMVKKQQMRWTQRGAHLLLQIRTKVLNNELEEVFRHWYPQFRAAEASAPAF